MLHCELDVVVYLVDLSVEFMKFLGATFENNEDVIKEPPEELERIFFKMILRNLCNPSINFCHEDVGIV